MSDYHTGTAFNARMAARRANPVPPLPLATFYHIAAMNNWQEVVWEQLSLLAFCEIKDVTACVLGSIKDALWARWRARSMGITMHVPFVNENLFEYESPTLTQAYLWAKDNQKGAVLYLHTKGVSAPGDPSKAQWRRAMQKLVVASWKENLSRLAVADIIGTSWQHNRDFPHFSGNFWMARADWLSRLQDPRFYRTSRDPNFGGMAGQSWWRMHCETWIGSQPWHHIDDLCPGPWPHLGGLLSMPVAIPGFSYKD